MLSVRAFLQGIFVLKVDQFTATARHRKVISIDFARDGADFAVTLTSTRSEEQGIQFLGGVSLIDVSFFTGHDMDHVKAATSRADHRDLTAVRVLLLVTSGLVAHVSVVVQAEARGHHLVSVNWLRELDWEGHLLEAQVDGHSHPVVLDVPDE
jgi:hypothetical protein